jgi:TonB-dependent receptor
MALRISAGARYEQTTVTSTAIGRLPTLIEVQASDLTALEVTFTEPGEVTGGHEYRFLLPNVDVNLELTDTLKLRADFARTLTRAPLNRLTPTLTVDATPRVGALTANGNNPALMPFLADNIDIGLEWYYADNSYLSAGAFIKEVSNFIVGGTTTQNINNVVDPTTGQLAEFSVTTFVNGESAQVTGLEFAVQHVFSDSGFGIQANATFVDTDKPYDETDISQTGFAVTGLANSANLVGFYENYGFHARIALNWRDEYLDAFGQRQNTSSFGAEPTFVNASTLVDFSTSYDFNEHLSVFFEGLNLTGETYSTHGRFDEQILDVIDTGSRYTVGVRGRF